VINSVLLLVIDDKYIIHIPSVEDDVFRFQPVVNKMFKIL
jgi:hypothetical protein